MLIKAKKIHISHIPCGTRKQDMSKEALYSVTLSEKLANFIELIKYDG